MTYFCVCTYDLPHATTADHALASKLLLELGLAKSMVAPDQNSYALPNTTLTGVFNGTSANVVAADLSKAVSATLGNAHLKHKVFVSAGESAGWSIVDL